MNNLAYTYGTVSTQILKPATTKEAPSTKVVAHEVKSIQQPSLSATHVQIKEV